jgi:hypothetical protein
MKHPVNLVGLEHLISVCRSRELRVELNPPLPAACGPDQVFLDQPLDPLLAATLARFNGATLAELGLFWMDDTPYGLGPFNARRRADDAWPLKDTLLYSMFLGVPYYLATIPNLADSNGVQPVVYINLSIDMEVMPIASSVDMAFDLYARYLETKASRNESLAREHGSIEAGTRGRRGFFFPRSIPALVAEDRRLVQMLAANRFKAFTAIDADLPDWSACVLAAAQGRT